MIYDIYIYIWYICYIHIWSKLLRHLLNHNTSWWARKVRTRWSATSCQMGPMIMSCWTPEECRKTFKIPPKIGKLEKRIYRDRVSLPPELAGWKCSKSQQQAIFTLSCLSHTFYVSGVMLMNRKPSLKIGPYTIHACLEKTHLSGNFTCFEITAN